MLEVVIVDDSTSDAKLIMMMAKRLKIANPFRHFESGQAALDFLSSDGALPGLILLDINMPLLNGHEVLKQIRSHPSEAVRRLPVVMLTTSDDPREISAAYSEHANSYVVKPLGLDQYQRIVEQLHEYWFQLVQMPSNQ